MTLLTVGKLRTGPFRELAAFYDKRLRPFGGLNLVELAHGAASLSPAERMAKEGAKIKARLKGDEYLVAFDKKGRMLSSRGWAKRIDVWKLSGRKVVLLIGGADGLAPDLVSKAKEQISFSEMTFPHELFRIMLYEQLYRGHCILAGHPYHK